MTTPKQPLMTAAAERQFLIDKLESAVKLAAMAEERAEAAASSARNVAERASDVQSEADDAVGEAEAAEEQIAEARAGLLKLLEPLKQVQAEAAEAGEHAFINKPAS